jgi:thiamine biosynthesis lipoprotein
VVDSEPERLSAGIEAAFAAVARVQQLMSYHDPLSELSRLNQTGHREPFEVTAWTYTVLHTAQQLAAESNGVFDITIAPRLASWGYLPRIPANGRAEKHATWRDLLLLSDGQVSFQRPLHLDLGGIAKGFAIDRAIEALQEAGISSTLVNAGGDLRAYGDRDWPVDIRHPGNPGQTAHGFVLRDAAVSTSAGYFSRKLWRNSWVCPLVDGTTRRPCDDHVSVSVHAPTGRSSPSAANRPRRSSGAIIPAPSFWIRRADANTLPRIPEPPDPSAHSHFSLATLRWRSCTHAPLMQRSSFRLSRPFKAAVYLGFGALLITGAGWLYAQGRLDDPGWETTPRTLMKLHGGAAMFALLVLGALTAHVKRGWKAHRNRLSGVILIAANAFLIISGYGLYYTGNEDLRAWFSRWHGWIGLGLGVLLPAHVIIGRWIMRALHRQRHPETPARAAHP